MSADSTLAHSLGALALASVSLGLVLGCSPAQAQQSASSPQQDTATPAAQAAQHGSNRGYVVGDGGVARRKAAGTSDDNDLAGRQAAPGAQAPHAPKDPKAQQTTQPKSGRRYLKLQSSETGKPGAAGNNDGTP